MIARTWHGTVPKEEADSYHQYLLGTEVTDYKTTEGNRSVYIFQHLEGDVALFLLLTSWESWDSIRAFAGDDPENARYYPEDEGYLLELEPFVKHYEVLATTV